MSKKTSSAAAIGFALFVGHAIAAGPNVAVTDLTYKDTVKGYFRVVNASAKSSQDNLNSKSESSYSSAEGMYTYIDFGELRTYTSDLKGALIKGGTVRLVQAKPYTAKGNEQIFDIVARIKQGYYPGADYVLFGTVSNIQFSQEQNRLTMGTSATATLTLDLVVDFSLINTKTYEVKAAFSASGSGQDVKIVARPGDRVVLNRSKVIADTSRTLADAAYSELMLQLAGPGERVGSQPTVNPAPEQPVKVY